MELSKYWKNKTTSTTFNVIDKNTISFTGTTKYASDFFPSNMDYIERVVKVNSSNPLEISYDVESSSILNAIGVLLFCVYDMSDKLIFYTTVSDTHGNANLSNAYAHYLSLDNNNSSLIALDNATTPITNYRLNFKVKINNDQIEVYKNNVPTTTATLINKITSDKFKLKIGVVRYTSEYAFLTKAEISNVVVNNRRIYFTNEDKLLLKSNNKIYSPKSTEILHETKMTSNTTPAPLVASASSVYASTAIFEPFMAFNGTFDGGNDCWASANNSPTGWIQIDYGTKKIVNRVRVSSRNLPSQTTTPKDFYILASNDGINFTSLLEVKNQTNWVASDTKIFDFENTSPFRYYRIKIISNNGGAYSTIGDILFSYLPKISVTQIPSSTIDNFINYGIPLIEDFNLIQYSKNYILQDTVSENSDGLWVQEIDRKPLGIKFE